MMKFDAMTEAAFEALDNGWPFSSLETKMVRYVGNNPRIIDMLIAQFKRVRS